MAIPRRNADPANISSEERTFFVTSSTWGRRCLLQSQRSASLFIDLLYEYKEREGFLLHGFVVMPDHFHLLLTLPPAVTIERAVELIKGGFAFRGSKAFGLPRPVWQRGFSEVRIYTEESFLKHREYIRQNAVRAHKCSVAEEFPYSSAHRSFELDDVPQRLKPREAGTLIGTPEGVP